MTPRPAQTLSLKGRALRYLAAREHSRAELATKLSRHVGPEDDPDAVARVLDELAAKGFIDEARVAESVLHRRAPLLGAQRVLQELRRKGLPESLLHSSAETLAQTEMQRAQAVWHRRFGSAAPPATPQERARQMRFLASRGFSTEVIRRVLRGQAQESADFSPDPGL